MRMQTKQDGAGRNQRYFVVEFLTAKEWVAFDGDCWIKGAQKIMREKRKQHKNTKFRVSQYVPKVQP